MKRFDWKQVIRVNIFISKVVGVWPPGDETYGCTFYTLYELFIVLCLQTCFIFSQTVDVISNLDNLQAVTGTIFVLLMEMLAPLKSFTLLTNMGMLKQLMTTVNSDLFQPRNSRQVSLVQPIMNAWKKTVGTFWFFTFGWLFFVSLDPIFDKTFREYRLPFGTWYPYSTKVSPQYELTYLHQFLAITSITLVNINMDAIIAALNMYIGAQLDILCDDVRHLQNSADVGENLIRCVQHHREIVKFAEFTNRFYNWMIFEEFFVGGVSIGISMFQLTVVAPLSNEFYSFVSYSFAVCVQVFLYCWFGNEIEVKSNSLSYAVFESDWTSLSPEIKKELIIFLIRVQRPVKMSAFGLFYLSLETFVKILRTAYSYFALLRQVNSPK
ncbi:7tm 6 domain containing protein [Asbolus verrucosus]|uniref:Odorant receptor n=1 Tax=Asbolus verrucosus TaxID=1661398 RepID=A0A482VCW3_ASBVE|nr:7tm 6 domain containing protein [Asbolus verrucosus]